jgi:hypothetical protein
MGGFLVEQKQSSSEDSLISLIAEQQGMSTHRTTRRTPPVGQGERRVPGMAPMCSVCNAKRRSKRHAGKGLGACGEEGAGGRRAK